MLRWKQVLVFGAIAVWAGAAWADDVPEEPAEDSETAREFRKAEEERLREQQAVQEEHEREVQKATEEAEKEGKPEKLEQKLADLEAKRSAKANKVERQSAAKRTEMLGKRRGGPGGKEDKTAARLAKIDEEREKHLAQEQEDYDRAVTKAKEQAEREGKADTLDQTLLRLENKHNADVERIEAKYAGRREQMLGVKKPERSKGEGKGKGKEKGKAEGEDGDDSEDEGKEKDQDKDKDKGKDKGPGKGKGHGKD